MKKPFVFFAFLLCYAAGYIHSFLLDPYQEGRAVEVRKHVLTDLASLQLDVVRMGKQQKGIYYKVKDMTVEYRSHPIKVVNALAFDQYMVA